VSSPSPSAGAPLVLVVDDNEKNLKLAREVLRAAGLRTIEAATGRAAVALAIERTPDVVLLDLELPDMHGTDVALELRKDLRTAQIPVVALSARPYAGDCDGLLAAGFVGYLEKPIDVGDFPAQVRSYCAPPST
jgi:two-component system, cell cycle response regulator DivK